MDVTWTIAWDSIPWNIIAPLLVVQLVLDVIALVSLAKAKKTKGPKWLWVLIILFVNIIGPVIYFVAGRDES